MTFTVDGHDMLKYVFREGYKAGRNDLDGPNAGRLLDTIMRRDYLGFKRKIELTLRPLTRQEWEHIEHDILRGKEYVTVVYDDFGRTVTSKMYSSSFNGTVSSITGRIIGATLNFIEV